MLWLLSHVRNFFFGFYLFALCTFSIAIVLMGTMIADSITPSVAKSAMSRLKIMGFI